MATGCDTVVKIDTTDKLNLLLNNGYCTVSFLGRYLMNAPNGYDKELTSAEVSLLSSVNILIVSIFQLTGDSANYFSYAQGFVDAIDAINRASALGQPNNTPIYFAVDFWPQLQPNEYSNVADYFAGVNAIINLDTFNTHGYKMGVYGCSTVCRMIKNTYYSAYTMLWGTTNCYDGTTFDNWNIHQGSQYQIASGNTVINICLDTSSNLGTGGWNLHNHSYPSNWTDSQDGSTHYKECSGCSNIITEPHSFPVTWQNYGNSVRHRHACIDCGAYEYQNHVPNPAGNRCIVCGYTGDIGGVSSTEGENE